MKLKDLSPNETTRRLNPHIYGRPLGPVEARQPEPALAPALDGRRVKRQEGKGGVAFRVAFTAYVRTLLDDDNLTGACKPVRDGVAASLGIDDGDGRIAFEYGQQQTKGPEGVTVRIDVIDNLSSKQETPPTTN